MRGIINGYKIRERREEDKWRIQIKYLKDGKVFAVSPVYEALSREKLIRIEEMLKDHTTYNRKVEILCRSIPLKTIKNEVDEIIWS